MNRVSVVITTCNRRVLLERAVKSVQNQTHFSYEIIIVDDCSEDDTAKTFSNREGEGIYYFRLTEKSGANVARNLGIKMARGEFVAFLDDDDFWKPEKLESQLKLMHELDAPFSYTGLHNVTPEEKTLKERFYPPSDPTDIFKSLMSNNFMGSTSSMMVNKAFIDEHNIRFDEQLGAMQDYDFYLQCFLHTNSVAAVDSCLTYYHQERSMSTSKTSAKFETFNNARLYLFKKYSENEHISLLKKSLNVVLMKKCVKYPPFFVGLVKSFFK